ncbi:MAG TPA: imidazolonepropionase [Longimicrobiales bacterium]
MSRITLFTNCTQIVTASGESVHEKSAVVVRDGRITGVVPAAQALESYPGATIEDCEGGVLTPGFVDSHTHAVFAGWRAAEFEMRARGLDYMEIARRGGGINASVADVRRRSEDELVELALPRLYEMVRHGTTTVEIKSGYGLTTEDELKMLRVIRSLQERVPLRVVPTFLGAHDVPLEYRDRRDKYVDLLVNEMLPAVAAERLAVFCDVFMEPGAFTAVETRRILTAAREHGFLLKLHADEFENSGAAELAVELGAVSADHLGAISDAGIAALAKSDTVATLLPATLFSLGKTRYAPARQLLDAGATVALATDYNPGTAPSPSMPLILTMACAQMRMTPLEGITAATAGGARAIRQLEVGVIEAGAHADVVLWRVADYREIPYRFGTPPVAGVWLAGDRVF